MLLESLPAEARELYSGVVDTLDAAGLEYLVGGAFALGVYTGIRRDTKDFDLFCRPADVPRTFTALQSAGYDVRYEFTHWLAKVRRGDYFVDLIYRAGNGLGEVDDAWFQAARETPIFDRPRHICPIEEIIWQKAYIMERERFDGADVIHLLRAGGPSLDWKRLLHRFGPDWRVLLSHLILFGFVYPGDTTTIPREVLEHLYARLAKTPPPSPGEERICRGTLISREQYLPDLEDWGYTDTRTDGRSRMTPEEIRRWTDAAPGVIAKRAAAQHE